MAFVCGPPALPSASRAAPTTAAASNCVHAAAPSDRPRARARSGRLAPAPRPRPAACGSSSSAFVGRRPVPAGPPQLCGAGHVHASRPAPVVAAASPVIILPGLGNNTSDYSDLKQLLESRGVPCYVLPVSRPDWLRNARGLVQRDWWQGRLRPLPILSWYVDRIAELHEEVRSAHGPQPVTLLGHSAGGWLARVYLSTVEGEGVRALVTLGTPHLAPPKGVLDQTRGLLTHVNEEYPGAYYADKLKYVCVIGLETEGKRLGKGSFAEWFAGLGYKQVSGVQETVGDFVVPVDSALLDGAEHIQIDGVFHSPVGAKEDRPWYGSQEVLDAWVHHLFD